jgi:hypothetical protein
VYPYVCDTFAGIDDVFNCVIAAPLGFGGGNPPVIFDAMAGMVDPLSFATMVLEVIIGPEFPPLFPLLGILSNVVEFAAGPVVPPVELALELPDAS